MNCTLPASARSMLTQELASTEDPMVSAFQNRNFAEVTRLLDEGVLWNIERVKAFASKSIVVMWNDELFEHNWCDGNEVSPLFVACREGNEEDISALLNNVSGQFWNLRTVKAFINNPNSTINCCLPDYDDCTPMSAVIAQLPYTENKEELAPLVEGLLQRAKRTGQLKQMLSEKILGSSVKTHIREEFVDLYVDYCCSCPPSPTTRQLMSIPALEQFLAKSLV